MNLLRKLKKLIAPAMMKKQKPWPQMYHGRVKWFENAVYVAYRHPRKKATAGRVIFIEKATGKEAC